MRRSPIRGLVFGAVLTLSSCATVIEDDPEATDATSVPATTLPVTVEVGLVALEDELRTLSGKIAAGEGDDESIELIVATWESIRSDVDAERPELIRGFDATIEMAELAVERTRPADADKAAANLGQYLDNYRAGD